MYDDLVDIRGGPRWGGATVVHLEQKGRGSLLRTTDVNLELTKEGSTEVKEKTKPKTIAALCEAEEGKEIEGRGRGCGKGRKARDPRRTGACHGRLCALVRRNH